MEPFIFTGMSNLSLTEQVEKRASTPQNPSMSAPIYLDTGGDLGLEVGPDAVRFVVDSRTMARASAPWKKMLHGGYAESKPQQGSWVVRLPEDDPEVLHILLATIHGDFSKTPNKPKLEQLSRIAELADKYDLAHLLRPWALSWCSDLDSSYYIGPYMGSDWKAPDYDTMAHIAWIAWVLGSLPLFEKATMGLVMEAEVDGDGQLLDPAGEPLLDSHIFFSVPDILGETYHDILAKRSTDPTHPPDSLATWRDSAIQYLLEPFQGLMDRLMTLQNIDVCLLARKSGVTLSFESLKTKTDCEMVLLGSLVRALAQAELFPLPDNASDIFEGVASLKSRLFSQVLANVKTTSASASALNGPHGSSGKFTKGVVNHEACHPREHIVKEIRESFRRLGAVTTETHHRLFSVAAKKTGMPLK